MHNPKGLSVKPKSFFAYKIAFASKQVNNFSLLRAIYCGIITNGRQINTAKLQSKDDERDSKLKKKAIESRGMVKIGASIFSLKITLELQAEIILRLSCVGSLR